MIFGLSTFGIYIYLMSHLDTISLREGKNYLIILPILFVLAMVEFYGEVKFGAKKTISLIKKGFIKLHEKIKIARLQHKIKKGERPSDKDMEWLAKHKGGNR